MNSIHISSVELILCTINFTILNVITVLDFSNPNNHH